MLNKNFILFFFILINFYSYNFYKENYFEEDIDEDKATKISFPDDIWVEIISHLNSDDNAFIYLSLIYGAKLENRNQIELSIKSFNLREYIEKLKNIKKFKELIKIKNSDNNNIKAMKRIYKKFFKFDKYLKESEKLTKKYFNHNSFINKFEYKSRIFFNKNINDFNLKINPNISKSLITIRSNERLDKKKEKLELPLFMLKDCFNNNLSIFQKQLIKYNFKKCFLRFYLFMFIFSIGLYLDNPDLVGSYGYCFLLIYSLYLFRMYFKTQMEITFKEPENIEIENYFSNLINLVNEILKKDTNYA